MSDKNTMANIPQDLKQRPQWKLCYYPDEKDPNTGQPIKTAKRPRGGPKVDFNTITWPDIEEHLSETKTPRYFGITLQQEDKLIALDIDKLPENFTFEDLPKEVQQLIKLVPTYTEVSPSGQGLHIWYKGDKELLAHRKPADQGTSFEGALYLRDQFITVTGNPYQGYSKESLAEIDPELLEKMIMKQVVVPQQRQDQAHLINSAPTLDRINVVLSSIPATLSESPHRLKIAKIYRHFEPPMENVSDYEHWRIVICAVHHAAAAQGDPGRGAQLIDEWSARDAEHYDGSEYVREKYYANPPDFSNPNAITYKTLFALEKAVTIDWPVKNTGKNAPKNSPVLVNVENWWALIKHYDISIAQNEVTKDYQIFSENHIAQIYFPKDQVYSDLDELKSCILRFAHNTHMLMATASHARTFAESWVMYEGEKYAFNPIKEWINSAKPYDKSVEPDYFEQLWNFIEIPEDKLDKIKLYKSYLKRSLMGIIRAHFYNGRHNATTGMVILSGPENTHKSTFVRMLLPQEFKNYVISSQLDAKKSAMKELQIETGTCQIWLRDEVEAMLKVSDEVVKNVLIQESDCFRPLYANKLIYKPRKCIFFGTTNQDKLPITDQGSRRIHIIPIEYIDTYAMDDFDMLNVYRQLLAEFKATPVKHQPLLWQLSKREIEWTNDVNYDENAAERTIDMLLRDSFAFEKEFNWNDFCNESGQISWKSSHIIAMRRIAEIVRNVTGQNVDRAQLNRAVPRLFGQWTGTRNKTITLNTVTIKDGMARVPKVNGIGSAKSGILAPPIKTDFEAEMLDSDEELE